VWYAFGVLRFEEALARILALGSPTLSAEDVALEDLDRRVLAEDLVSSIDLPSFHYSAMDGYAVRIADLAEDPPFRLPVRGESRTGGVAPALEARSTMRIFTGAELPADADAVVMQEQVTREGDDAILSVRPRPGQHVRRRGSDLAAGTVAIPKGRCLRSADLSLVAALDRASAKATRRPHVAIVATGDELRRPGTAGRPGSIPESNTVALRVMAQRAGAIVRVVPYVPDERAAIERAFAEALGASDVVVTIGGVSVGDHDLVRPALEAVGVSLDFWRIAIKPGKPLAVGRFARRPGSARQRDAIVLGLPGNPASAMVTFGFFGVPLLRALQGHEEPCPKDRERARMRRPHAHEPGRLEIVRAKLGRDDDGHLAVTTLDNQASGAVTTMAQADAFVLVPADSTGVSAGDEVDVVLASDLGF
jgi:molybdopterin molybdotransferase